MTRHDILQNTGDRYYIPLFSIEYSKVARINHYKYILLTIKNITLIIKILLLRDN